MSPEFSGEITDAIIYEYIFVIYRVQLIQELKTWKIFRINREGTKNDEGLATGLDHLKEMGITHLHLLPI